MNDPITTIVSAITEHTQAAAAVASVYGAARPFLAKLLGPAAEEIGEIGRDYITGQRARNTERTLSDADKLLAEVKRVPQIMPLATLVPLLQAASLQNEPPLAEKWAALLANAADPAQRVAVQPGFAEILRQLTPTDARVLEYIYRDQPNFSTSFVRPKSVGVAALVDLNISPTDTALSVENILRLRLGERRVGGFDSSASVTPLSASFDIVPTIYGQQFMLAVTPPTP